jgi:2-polyprenyl-6-methoxyphenol hydroxylase-like FAD-dependent oxidoreductase
MSRIVGEHAIVVGAGMGGLAAAKALAAHFDLVTVLERDPLPMDATPRGGWFSRDQHKVCSGSLAR